MIPCVSHAMTPRNRAVFKQKFPAHLPIIAAFSRTPPAFEALDKGSGHDGEERFLHVLRTLGAEIERSGHAEEVVEFARGVGVDGEGAVGGLSVHGDEIGMAAADDDDLRGCGKGVECFGSDGR